MLTPKQQRFVDEYLVDLNATQAAIRAGYSAKTAQEIGSENLSKPMIAEAVRARQEERSARTRVTADRVVTELAKVAFLDPRRVMSWGPDGVTFTASHTLAPEDAACVAEASQTVTKDGGTIKVKLADKLAALQLIGRHLGMFTDNVKVDGEVSAITEVVVRTREEAAAFLPPKTP